MNNLIDTITKEVEQEEKDKDLAVKKTRVRAMLSLIKSRRQQIERLQGELKDIEKQLAEENFSLVTSRVKTTHVNVNGITWTYTNRII